jgi:ABC-type antimicrobial peptide transport system permease subunit
VDKGFPVFDIKTLALRIDDSLARERLIANLSGLFGLIALALAAQGLYGILAFAVARRTREIGIRMALGSSARATLWMVAREALGLVGIGSAVGLLMTVAASRIASSYLAGVSSMNAGILAAGAMLMMLVAAAAVTIPALRACRVDPLVALRSE